MQPEILKFFAHYIHQEIGIVYADHNYFQLQNRLEEIAKLLNIPTVEALYEVAKQGISGELRRILLDMSTNNETLFFRDPNLFNRIQSLIVPELIKQITPANPVLNVWSAACSTGQEPYSLVILLNELSKKLEFSKFKITATDFSDRALERAKSASYTYHEINRGLDPVLRDKYFTKDSNERWVLHPEWKNLVEIKKQNLKEPFSFTEKFNLILCRNVLIYQNVEGKADIVARITKCLLPGGYLLLGAGESLLGVSTDYEQLLADGVVLYKLK